LFGSIDTANHGSLSRFAWKQSTLERWLNYPAAYMALFYTSFYPNKNSLDKTKNGFI